MTASEGPLHRSGVPRQNDLLVVKYSPCAGEAGVAVCSGDNWPERRQKLNCHTWTRNGPHLEQEYGLIGEEEFRVQTGMFYSRQP